MDRSVMFRTTFDVCKGFTPYLRSKIEGTVGVLIWNDIDYQAHLSDPAFQPSGSIVRITW